MSITASNDMTGATRGGLTLSYQSIQNAVFWIFIASGSIVIIEPSPYDYLWMIAVLLWLLGGVKFYRGSILFVALIMATNLSGFITLIPSWHVEDSRSFMWGSFYLTIACIYFGLFFAENTARRVELCLSAYGASCILASVIAILGYLDVFGLAAATAPVGRAMGSFKDPNVLGSYVIMGLLYYTQRILLGRTRYVLLTLINILLILGAIFLSFSRGSWGAAVVGLSLCVAMTFITTDNRVLRQRISFMFFAMLALAGIALAILLSLDSVAELFKERFSLSQSYDQGEAGRFGNQLRSIPMLLERPLGFGPLRFREIFDLEPHNSYIGAFANNGWFGGFAWLALVGITTFVGFRLCFTVSPYMRPAQVVWPALFGFFLQAFQIDIDHWRFVFLMLGLIWGMETTRQRWVMHYRPTATTALN